MSDTAFSLHAETRSQLGKGATRRLRRIEKKTPIILYGGNEKDAPETLSVSAKDFQKHLESEAFYSHILTLHIGDRVVQVVLKDIQRHPVNDTPIHADFIRVDKDHLIRMHVPLHFINEDKCYGVKTQGGQISHQVTEVEISCLPQNLPEFIEVDMENVKVNQMIHLSDLKLPDNTTLYELTHGASNDALVVSVKASRGSDDSEETPTEEA